MISLLRCFAVVVLALTICGPLSAQKKVSVSGTILGSDGKPLPKSHAHLTKLPWTDSKEHRYIIETGKDGTWMMRVYPGLYRVEFTGVNHRRTEAVHAMITEDGDNSFSTRLGVNPYFSESEIDTVFIVYEHPKTFVRTYDPMTPLGAGRYRAMLPCFSHTTTVYYHISGLMPDRYINGTQSLRYIYDGDGDYESCVDCPKNASDMEIILDLALLPDVRNPEAAKEYVEGSPLRHPVARGASELLDVVEKNREKQRKYSQESDALSDTIASGADGRPWREPRDNASRSWKFIFTSWAGVHYYYDSVSTAQVRARFHAERKRDIEAHRQAFEQARRSGTQDDILFAAAATAELLSQVGKDSIQQYAELITEVFTVIPPESPVWTLTNGFSLPTRLAENDHRSYLAGMIWRQTSKAVRQKAYTELFGILRRSGTAADSLRLRVLFDSEMSVCVDDDCGSSAVIEAALGYAGYKRWRLDRFRKGTERGRKIYESLPPDTLVGRPIPAFRLLAVDSSQSVLTDADLRGNPYLFVGIRRDALGIIAGVEAAMEAERLYASHGLRSVCCIDVPNPDRLKRSGSFLSYKAYTADKDWETLLTFSTMRNRNPYFILLVDDKGIVRASTERLNDEFLFYTLREFFGE